MDDGKDNLLESQGGEEPERWQEVRTSRLESTDGGERKSVTCEREGKEKYISWRFY